MTIINNIEIRQNPVKRGQEFLRNLWSSANPYTEIEFTKKSDCSQVSETDYLLRSAENRKRILKSIAQLDSGQGTIRELIE